MNAETSEKLQFINTKKDSESRSSTSKNNNSMEGNCKKTGQKRKSCSSPEPPRKRQRGSEESVEVEMPRGTKRRASSPSESPKKRKRGCGSVTDTHVASEVSVENVTARGTKRKGSPERESPKKKRRETDTSNTSGESTKESVESDSETVINDDQLSENEDSWSPYGGAPDLFPSSYSLSTFEQDEHSSVYDSMKMFETSYQELYKLGEGGFGSVYAGYRNSDNLPVAIKHIPKKIVKTLPIELNGLTTMIPTEVFLMIRAAGGPEELGQSAAITPIDWFEMEQEVVLVMERPLSCIDLHHYLFLITGPMKEDTAKNIMKQLTEAAFQMHSLGVFHRDIKLENILVETDPDVPRVRIIDFGCGLLMGKEPYSEFSGTFAYAPPEYFLEKKYTAAPTTVWQLGAVLYELLTGSRQFSTSRFLCNEMTFFHDLRRPNVSKDCFEFLKICLAKDPKQRATLEQIKQHPWLA